MVVAFYITLGILLLVVYLFERGRSKSESRFFVERQQMQSKIDTLTEHLLQQSGHPVDLNKHVRDQFKQALAEKVIGARPFRHGWKRDDVATPRKPEVNGTEAN